MERDLAFLPESTGLDDMMSIGDALRALKADSAVALPPEPTLIDFFGPGPRSRRRKAIYMIYSHFFSRTSTAHYMETSPGQEHTYKLPAHHE